MPKRKRYNEETLTEKKKRLKREMDKYKYRFHNEKIKQVTFEELSDSKPLNSKRKK